MSMKNEPRDHPNVILIMVDQMRYDSGGFAGNALVRTPALDQLARQGVCFENAYCSSPVCSPARASWLTGLYPHAHSQLDNYGLDRAAQWGRYLPPDTTTIGDVLHAEGYACGIIGRWHLGNDDAPQHGFHDLWCTEGYQSLETNQYYQFLRSVNPGATEPKIPAGQVPRVATLALPTEQQRTSWGVTRAIEFCQSQRSPFFLFLSIKDPHPPLIPPQETLDLYPVDRMPLPSNWRESLNDKPSYLTASVSRYADHLTDDQARQMVAHYAALVTHVDRQLQRLFDALEQNGLADDTLVAFISDHGEMLGDHGLFNKRVMYEGATRVPCILRWPRHLPAGFRVSSLFAGVDLMPTLLDLIGLPAPSPLHGRSVAADLIAARQPADHPILSEVSGDVNNPAEAAHVEVTDHEDLLDAHAMIRVERWKYVRHRYDIEELYDLQADPGEMDNVADEPKQRDKLDEMRRHLTDEIAREPTGSGPYDWCLTPAGKEA